MPQRLRLNPPGPNFCLKFLGDSRQRRRLVDINGQKATFRDHLSTACIFRARLVFPTFSATGTAMYGLIQRTRRDSAAQRRLFPRLRSARSTVLHSSLESVTHFDELVMN